uniref:Secreted protein n=2 Tax=Parascaris univalens TaxID=6257 RepID=A0A915BUK5_PARUN
ARFLTVLTYLFLSVAYAMGQSVNGNRTADGRISTNVNSTSTADEGFRILSVQSRLVFPFTASGCVAKTLKKKMVYA